MSVLVQRKIKVSFTCIKEAMMPNLLNEIVRVVDLNHQMYRQQGQVVEIQSTCSENLPFAVLFGFELDYMFSRGLLREEMNNIWWFAEGQIAKCPNWDLERICNRLFGSSMWHSVPKITRGFDSNAICEHRDCNERASDLALVNIWGTVCQYCVCLLHLK